jgi:ribonuclease E
MGKISRFGLLELSRQRLRPALAETSYITCPRCTGTGHIRSTESAALHILRILEEEAMKENTGAIHAQVPVDVGTFLLNEKRVDIARIEVRHRINLVIVPNRQFETPQHEIIRLRHDQLNAEDITIPSYQMAEKKMEEAYQPPSAQADTKPARPEAAVKGITPDQPAPVVGPRPEPAPETKPQPGLIAKIIGWFTGGAPSAPSEPESKPEKSSRKDRDSRGERGGRERGERGERGRNRRENRENREGREAREGKSGQQGERQRAENQRQQQARRDEGTDAQQPPKEQKEGRRGRGDRGEPRQPKTQRAEAITPPAPTADTSASPLPLADTPAVESAGAPESTGEGGGRRRGRGRGGRGRGERREEAAVADTPGVETGDEALATMLVEPPAAVEQAVQPRPMPWPVPMPLEATVASVTETHAAAVQPAVQPSAADLQPEQVPIADARMEQTAVQPEPLIDVAVAAVAEAPQINLAANLEQAGLVMIETVSSVGIAPTLPIEVPKLGRKPKPSVMIANEPLQMIETRRD